ncbi:hypothetical protein CVT26_010394 [Gymnopilus dilepis]|uniref:Uncharacterized protein n=1 Tax=Gymnopilus dilepis TaxID=231916 RepID=A0A409VZ41_9AGAR|nr:hypothetical protein CVT26_010394 [Gymnopilus dilepis]
MFHHEDNTLEHRIYAASMCSFHSDSGKYIADHVTEHLSNDSAAWVFENSTLEHRICAASAPSFHSDEGRYMADEVIETSVDQERSLKIPNEVDVDSQEAGGVVAFPPPLEDFVWFDGRLCPRAEIPSVLLDFHDIFEGDGSQTPTFDTQWVNARQARDALRDNGRSTEEPGHNVSLDKLRPRSVTAATSICNVDAPADNSDRIPQIQVSTSTISHSMPDSLLPAIQTKPAMTYQRAKKLLGMSWRDSMRAKILYKDSQKRFSKDLKRFRRFLQ